MSKPIYRLKSGDRPVNLNINYAHELNPEQLKVVSEGEGPCLVLAGAGSGKTRTLVFRVAYLLAHGIKPDNILLMTFTNKAAKEMLFRVESLLGYKPKGLWGGTFHHIGNLILRRHINKLGYKTNYTILDETDAKDLLQSVIARKNLNKDKYFPKATVIKNIISFSINSGNNLNKTYTEKFSYLEKKLFKPTKKIAEQYQTRKKELNTLDYDDLLVLWLALIKKFPEVKSSLAKKFKYIMVDEYQDTNHLQAQIVEAMTSHHGNVLVVGDDAQSIYSFRAADITNILSFPKKFKPAKIFKLETNYRSTPQILALANNSIKNNLEQFPKKLKSVKPNGAKPTLIPAPNNETQARFVVQRIIEMTEEGHSLKDIAVLFRADYQALELELELNKKEVPYIKRGGIKFFAQAHLKDMLAFLKIVHNPQDEIAWTRVLNLQAGIGRVGAQQIIDRRRRLDLNATIKMKNDFPKTLAKAWQGFTKVLKPLTTIDENNIASLLQSVIDNFYSVYVTTHFDNATSRLEDLQQLINFSSSYESLAKFLADTALSENWQTENVAAQDKYDDYLIISTIHQAKGLEWPVVFIINLISGQFPHIKAMAASAEVEEERRLFYVACTRAQTKLYLTYPQVNYGAKLGFIFNKPSEFIRELNENLFDQWQLADEQGDNLPTIEYN